jgi:hypothetical protein
MSRYKKLHTTAAPFSISVVMCMRVWRRAAAAAGRIPMPYVGVLVGGWVSIRERAFFHNFILGQYFQYFAQRVCLKNNKVLAVVEIHLGALGTRAPLRNRVHAGIKIERTKKDARGGGDGGAANFQAIIYEGIKIIFNRPKLLLFVSHPLSDAVKCVQIQNPPRLYILLKE